MYKFLAVFFVIIIILDPNFSRAEQSNFSKNLAAAKQGHKVAQNNIGLMYFTGNGVAKDLGKAAIWFEKSANQEFPDAMYNMGHIYENGLGVPKDLSKAYDWYAKTSQYGNPTAMFRMGVLYQIGALNGGRSNFKFAEKWVRKAALKGHAEAQNRLAYFYGKGWGVKQDDEEASKWYLKAAKQGLAKAQYNMGENYLHGSGVLKSTHEAKKWYTKSAKQDYTNAMFKLGVIYFQEFSLQEGYSWLKKASLKGHEESKDLISEMYRDFPKYIGIPEDPDEAFKWYIKQAEKGDRDAMYMLGKSYLNLGNEPEGVKWIEDSASLGQPYSKKLLELNKRYYAKRRHYKEKVEQRKSKVMLYYNNYDDMRSEYLMRAK